MGLTTVFRDHMCGLAIGEALDPFDNTNAYLGVGDSTTAFDAAQTDLQAVTNKLRKAMISGSYPSRATNVLTFKSSFGSTDANFDWEEIAAFNAATDGVMMCRLVSSKGSKAAGSTWELTFDVTITVTAAA